MAVVWFLDVDGVISPVVDRPDLPQLYSTQTSSAASVPYDPLVIDRIRGIAQRGVQLRWLTSWEPEWVLDWVRVGLGPFPHDRSPIERLRRGWKPRVVRDWLLSHLGDRVVWTDDDLERHRSARMFVDSVPEDRLLAIAPAPEVGLTSQELDRIEAWIAGSL